MPCLAQTRHMLRKLALDRLYLGFESLDSLACLSGKLLVRLQKQLTQLPFVHVELLHQLLGFTSLAVSASRRSSTTEIQNHAFVA